MQLGRKKIKKLLVVVAVIVLGLSTSALALNYSYETLPGDSGPGEGIIYTLNITGTSATFSISGSSSSDDTWYLGWVTFKLGQGKDAWAFTSSLASPDGTGPWSISDKNQNTSVKVLAGGGSNYNQLRDDGSAGFYVTSLGENTGPAVISQGILLTGDDPISASFSFTFGDVSGVLRTDLIPFQVGYYELGGNTRTNQLSKNLTVPEPGILILLGIAMSAIGVASWRIRKL